MPKVEIYTGMMCGYCTRALRLLDSKDVVYKQIDVSMNAKLRGEMRGRAGGRTSVPQIFIDGMHVGGCQELYALEGAGKLDALLAA
jgi:glutaredoxin 3